MLLHANAKLGLAGRFALVRAVEDGLSLKAAAFKVSPKTAHRCCTVGKPIHDNGRSRRVWDLNEAGKPPPASQLVDGNRAGRGEDA